MRAAVGGARAKRDFAFEVDRAAGLTVDAACAARVAASGPLPPPHRRWIQRAIDKLEGAELDLFKARNDPWSEPPTAHHRQLTLL